MANSYKYLSDNDRVVSSTDLETSVAISQSNWSGSSAGFQTLTSSYFTGLTGSTSAVRYFDVTVGRHPDTSGSNTSQSLMEKVYTEMAKVLLGTDVSGNVLNFAFDSDVNVSNNPMYNAYFLNFSRDYFKDEIKKGSFNLVFSCSLGTASLVDKSGSAEVTASSCPVGEYARLFISGADTSLQVVDGNRVQGLMFYQAGIAVVSPSIFAGSNSVAYGSSSDSISGSQRGIWNDVPTVNSATVSQSLLLSTANLQSASYSLYSSVQTASFSSVTEMHSTLYFCRLFNNEFNYSSNPTYLTNSQIYVKNGDPLSLPISYITTVGLYSEDDQLLAVAKLSEPIKKTPEVEAIIRTRLDF
jgi:hypothetical protein